MAGGRILRNALRSEGEVVREATKRIRLPKTVRSNAGAHTAGTVHKKATEAAGNKTITRKILESNPLQWANEKVNLSREATAIPKEVNGGFWNQLQGAGKYAIAGTWGDKAKKAGVYMGGAIGLRMLNGGTITRNNSGERDIAGIPFI